MSPAKFFLLGVKEVFLLGVKEVREVKEVKAICFENTGVKNSEVKPLPLLIIVRPPMISKAYGFNFFNFSNFFNF